MDSHHTPEPAPTGNGKIVLDEVLKDLKERAEAGMEKYGTYLRTNNGRKALVDAYQEQCDNLMYMKQYLMEMNEIKPYKSWDFCASINCRFTGLKERCKSSGCKAYEFHQYLKQNCQIIEEY